MRVLVRSGLSRSIRARWLHSATLRQQRAAVVAVNEDKRLTLQCEGEQEKRFHGVWLRHNCRCPVCYSHDTNMSLVNYTQLIGVELASAHVQGPIATYSSRLTTLSISLFSLGTGDQVIMDWINRLQDGSTHTGSLPLSWLKDNDYSLPESFTKRQQEAKPIVAVSCMHIANLNYIVLCCWIV